MTRLLERNELIHANATHRSRGRNLSLIDCFQVPETPLISI
jgi:hypothetical protein